jgi:acyl-CoA synthetase (AMP-forming)/AMP-acid ligase II
MAPLLRGASVVCLPESNVHAFFSALDEYRLTWLSTGFTIHRAILEHAAEHRSLVARSGLRVIRAGSGRLDPGEIDRIEQLFRAPLLVALTSSEALPIAINPLPPRARKSGSVGLPLGNEVAILGNAGACRTAGETGEIIVRGPGVLEGYLDDPALNAASFANGWFRTGDLGRFDEDGYLYLIGRIKDVINRGGDKISPAEIDAAITALAGVEEAATFSVRHSTLGEEIVAAVVRSGDTTIEEPEIIDAVRLRMGDLRVPRRIYFVDRLPQTENGKVRRSELPRLLGLDQACAAPPNESAVASSAPMLSPLEAALAGLWSTVLQVASVGANDDFFLLGGDSLRGARLLTSVKTVFGVELTIRALFGEAATVAGMARAIEDARAGVATAG